MLHLPSKAPRRRQPLTYLLICRTAGAVKVSQGLGVVAYLPVLPGFCLEVGPVLSNTQATALQRQFAHLHIQHGWLWLTPEVEQWAKQIGQ